METCLSLAHPFGDLRQQWSNEDLRPRERHVTGFIISNTLQTQGEHVYHPGSGGEVPVYKEKCMSIKHHKKTKLKA
jgi:hypothetical protein